ncbi:phospholipase D-like domain-containing protein, partial [Klebsiella pneumoniae]
MTLTNILVNAGVKVRLTDAYKIHHDKVIIIDRSTVETGSFNFTK